MGICNCNCKDCEKDFCNENELLLQVRKEPESRKEKLKLSKIAMWKLIT